MNKIKFIARLATCLISLAVAAAIAQQTADQGAPPTAPAVRVTTHLVLLDVIATDKDGKPVTDLKKEDFKVEENGKGQQVSMFSLEQPVAQLPPPERPANVYTNRPAYNLPQGTATILLLDALNSPFRDQAFARKAMLDYAANQIKSGSEVAVFGLGSRLYELQSFTSDPALLRNAVERFHPQAMSNGPGSTIAPPHGSAAFSASVPTLSLLAENAISTFASEQTSYDLQFRIYTTLSAMNDLARLVAAKTGRKNLVWLTANLPFSLIPNDNDVSFVNMHAGDPTTEGGTAPPLAVNPNGGDAFALASSDIHAQASAQVKRAASLLAEEQVAIYPVDVRGMIGSLATDSGASGSDGRGFLITDTAFGQSVSGQNAYIEGTQAPMYDLAKQTGGIFYKNRNDIANAVGEAAADGGTYYELGYYPDHPKFDGSYHHFKVSVARPGVQLRYRPGYFAIDPAKLPEKDRKAELASALTSSPDQSSMVIFDAQVTPPAPAEKMTVPVKMLVRPDTITAATMKDGKRAIDVDYFAIAFGANGREVANQGKSVRATLDSNQYSELMQKGLLLSLDVPLTPGQYQLKLAVRDNPSGYFGTLNVPLELAKK